MTVCEPLVSLKVWEWWHVLLQHLLHFDSISTWHALPGRVVQILLSNPNLHSSSLIGWLQFSIDDYDWTWEKTHSSETFGFTKLCPSDGVTDQFSLHIIIWNKHCDQWTDLIHCPISAAWQAPKPMSSYLTALWSWSLVYPQLLQLLVSPHLQIQGCRNKQKSSKNEFLNVSMRGAYLYLGS